MAFLVLTHLDEELQFAWLAELERLVGPEGIVILTVQGQREAQRLLAPDDFQKFAAKGFLYRRTLDPSVEGMPDFYQVTYHRSDYVQRMWTEWLEPIGSIRHGSMYTQEAVVLRKQKTKTGNRDKRGLPVLFDLPIGVLEVPIFASVADDELWLRGWAFYPDGRPLEIDVWIDSTWVARAHCCMPKPYVGLAFSFYVTSATSGFEIILPLVGFSRAHHIIWIAPAYEPFPVPICAAEFSRREGLQDDLARIVKITFGFWWHRLRCGIRLRTRIRNLARKLRSGARLDSP